MSGRDYVKKVCANAHSCKEVCGKCFRAAADTGRCVWGCDFTMPDESQESSPPDNDEMMEAVKVIGEVLASMPEVSMLRDLVARAGDDLKEVALSFVDSVPFTVLVPTNEAFTKLPAKELAKLSKQQMNLEDLVDVLSYHGRLEPSCSSQNMHFIPTLTSFFTRSGLSKYFVEFGLQGRCSYKRRQWRQLECYFCGSSHHQWC